MFLSLSQINEKKRNRSGQIMSVGSGTEIIIFQLRGVRLEQDALLRQVICLLTLQYLLSSYGVKGTDLNPKDK